MYSVRGYFQQSMVGQLGKRGGSGRLQHAEKCFDKIVNLLCAHGCNAGIEVVRVSLCLYGQSFRNTFKAIPHQAPGARIMLKYADIGTADDNVIVCAVKECPDDGTLRNNVEDFIFYTLIPFLLDKSLVKTGTDPAIPGIPLRR